MRHLVITGCLSKTKPCRLTVFSFKDLFKSYSSNLMITQTSFQVFSWRVRDIFTVLRSIWHVQTFCGHLMVWFVLSGASALPKLPCSSCVTHPFTALIFHPLTVRYQSFSWNIFKYLINPQSHCIRNKLKTWTKLFQFHLLRKSHRFRSTQIRNYPESFAI